jgi:hypothetical protein
MTRRISLLWLLTALVAGPLTAPAQAPDFIHRGRYFVAPEAGVEMWIPGWVNQKDEPRPGMVGEFGIKVMDHFLQMYVVVNTRTLDGFVTWRNKKAADTFRDGKLEIIERLDGCRHPTVVAIHTEIDTIPGYDSKDLIVSATDVEGKKTVDFHIVCAKGQAKAILPVVRWMASSIRLSGEAGLSSSTGPRRLDRASGLSHRLPEGFEAADAAQGEAIAAADESIGSRIAVRQAAPEVVDALTKKAGEAKAGVLRLVKMAHPEKAAVLLAFHAPKGEPPRSLAEAVVTFADGPTFVIEATGPAEHDDALREAVELMAVGLRWIDVKKAASAAASAAAEIEEAARDRNAERVRSLMDALVTGSFLPEARSALEKTLDRLEEPEQVRAIEAFAASGDVAAVPAVVKLYGSSRFRKRTDMRRAVLASLRHLQGPAALKLLLSEVRSRETVLAVTAVVSLGHYRTDRAEVIRKFVSLLKKEESAENSRSLAVRQRWITLRAAYEAALKRLTGRAFSNAGELDAWYRANKSSL